MQQMIFIADLIAYSTCFAHHYAHHQELESIIQVVAACGIWCFGFQVVGMVWGRRLCVRFEDLNIFQVEIKFEFIIILKVKSLFE
jgi:hypothetical protein